MRPPAPCPRPGRTLLALGVLAALLLPGSVRAERGLPDKILESKYHRGDYGFYLGWYDPWDRQFDQHGSFALPIGGKVRFRLRGPLRVEMDMSYFRKGGSLPAFYQGFETPGFDGVVIAASLQGAGKKIGPIRPYVGAGPAFVSLGDDFAANVRSCVDLASDCRGRAISWSEVDVGIALTAGLDLAGTRRIFPFVEYRHLLGQLEVGDFHDGVGTWEPEEIVYLDGTDISRKYDWSGPNVLAGLRIRF